MPRSIRKGRGWTSKPPRGTLPNRQDPAFRGIIHCVHIDNLGTMPPNLGTPSLFVEAIGTPERNQGLGVPIREGGWSQQAYSGSGTGGQFLKIEDGVATDFQSNPWTVLVDFFYTQAVTDSVNVPCLLSKGGFGNSCGFNWQAKNDQLTMETSGADVAFFGFHTAQPLPNLNRFYRAACTCTGFKLNGSPTASVSAITATNPAVVTTVAPHGLSNGTIVFLENTTATPNVNTQWTISGVTASTFTIPVSVTGAQVGTAGTVDVGNAAQNTNVNNTWFWLDGVRISSGDSGVPNTSPRLYSCAGKSNYLIVNNYPSFMIGMYPDNGIYAYPAPITRVMAWPYVLDDWLLAQLTNQDPALAFRYMQPYKRRAYFGALSAPVRSLFRAPTNLDGLGVGGSFFDNPLGG